MYSGCPIDRAVGLGLGDTIALTSEGLRVEVFSLERQKEAVLKQELSSLPWNWTCIAWMKSRRPSC